MQGVKSWISKDNDLLNRVRKYMANTQDMLKSLENDDVNAFKDQVSADLQDRVRQHIDLKKIEIAKNLVTGQQAVEATGSETATEEN